MEICFHLLKFFLGNFCNKSSIELSRIYFRFSTDSEVLDGKLDRLSYNNEEALNFTNQLLPSCLPLFIRSPSLSLIRRFIKASGLRRYDFHKMVQEMRGMQPTCRMDLGWVQAKFRSVEERRGTRRDRREAVSAMDSCFPHFVVFSLVLSVLSSLSRFLSCGKIATPWLRKFYDKVCRVNFRGGDLSAYSRGDFHVQK